MRPLACVPCLLSLCLLATPIASGEDEVPGRAAIERDLVLETKLTTPDVVQPGEPVHVAARIVNRSTTHTYKLVKPGDGSESGWREPHVFFTATVADPRGARTPLAPCEIGRCGLFDPEWHDEVVTLGPGDALELVDWMPAAHHAFDFQRQGPVFLRLHYRYSRGKQSMGGETDDADEDVGPMGETPAFELVSDPVRFTVHRHLDIRLEVVSPMEVGQSTRLSEVLRLHVTNRSAGPLPVSGSEIEIELVPQREGPPLFSHRRRIEPTVERKTPPLSQRATRTWEGDDAWNELTHWQLTATRPGTFEVVARWSRTGGRARYRSEPARIRVRGE